MKGRIPAALAAAALLVTATAAWADFTPEGSPYPSGGDAPYNVYAADFDGDGRPDFAVTNGDNSPNVSLYLRQAAGGFAQEGAPVAGASSNGAVGDFNGDGRPDLAVAGFVGEGLAVLLRNAGGGFTRESPPPLGGVLSAIGVGDFNRDGRVDMAVGNWGPTNTVSILVRNATNNGFDVVENDAAGANPRQIAVADYNGDGNLDLAVLNNGSLNVRVLLGNGAGAFVAEGADISVGANPQSIVTADFDGNGRPDLAISNAAASTVTVLLRNAGNTGFAEDTGSPVATSAGPAGMAVADFDRNGTADLAVAATSGALDVLQRGPSGFTRTQTTAVTGQPSGVAVADFNGDGVADAVVSSLGTNQVTALLSPSPPPAPTPPPPSPSPPPGLDAPTAGEVNLVPAKGKVKVRLKGTKKFVDLATGGLQVKAGAEVDTRDGRVTIVGPGKSDKADFYDGLFVISQSKGLTTLTLSEKLTGCPKAKKKTARVAAKKPKTRKLWGDGKGKFRTKGSYSAATVRGTRWLVSDTCTTTTTRVAEGSVSVQDLVKKKTVILRKGKRYTARQKR